MGRGVKRSEPFIACGQIFLLDNVVDSSQSPNPGKRQTWLFEEKRIGEKRVGGEKSPFYTFRIFFFLNDKVYHLVACIYFCQYERSSHCFGEFFSQWSICHSGIDILPFVKYSSLYRRILHCNIPIYKCIHTYWPKSPYKKLVFSSIYPDSPKDQG